MDQKPKLRPLDFQPVLYQNQQMWYLRDPLQLTKQQLILPAPLAAMLVLLDGAHTEQEIHEGFCRQLGEHVDYIVVADALERLDQALLLDNERSKQAKDEALAAYRAQPYRPPALAGHGYPEQPQELAAYLDEFVNGMNGTAAGDWSGRGIVSPHIDYERGGRVYAAVWQRTARALQEADLVLIFGTDHNGGPGSVTLTRQAYATPYGVLDTDLALIDKLEAAIGETAAYDEELNHRQEHSIELSAVWMAHVARQNGVTPPPMVPILVGSFHHFVMNGGHPAEDERLTAVIDTLRSATKGKRVLAVASVDLAHMGPVFGDAFAMSAQRRLDLQRQDQELMAAAAAGDAGQWYGSIAGVGDRNRICGFAPTYLLLRYLGAGKGATMAYEQCPADPENHSLVSICGLLID